MPRTARFETAELARQGILDLWTEFAKGHHGVRVALGEDCPKGMLMWSVISQAPVHQETNLGHWAFPSRDNADAAVKEMDAADRTRNTVLSKRD